MITSETVSFLTDLANNNSTEWMHANKKRYDNYKKSYHRFIQDLLDEMKQYDATLENLEVKNCTFRINRDIRFSKNKSPYKTNMGIWLPQNKYTKNGAGYYVHFEKGKSFIAGGIWCPESTDLKKIRKEIEFFYDDLNTISQQKEFKKEFQEFDKTEENQLKKAPKDFDANHPAIEHLKLKSFTVSQPINDDLFFQPNCVNVLAKKLSFLKPVNDFLTRSLIVEE
jgi:uncharacterized protein (TIGR02453 family)